MEEQDSKYSLDEIVAFLTGSATLDELWFGERDPGRPIFWWRKHLTAAVAATQAAAERAEVRGAIVVADAIRKRAIASSGDCIAPSSLISSIDAFLAELNN